MLLLGTSLAACARTPPIAPIAAAAAVHDTALQRLLTPLGIAPGELGIRGLNHARDPWRLRIVDHLLARPLETIGAVRGLAEGLREARGSVVDLLQTAGRCLDLDLPDTARSTQSARPLADLLWALQRSGGEAITRAELARQIDRVPGAVQAAVADLLATMASAAPALRGATASLSDADRAFIIANVSHLDADSMTLDETSTWRLLDLAARVDRSRILSASLSIAAAVDRARVALSQWRRAGKPGLAAGSSAPFDLIAGDVLLAVDTVLGPVVIGGPGPTIYRRDAALVVDLGGDDRYENRAGGTVDPGRPIAIVIDVDGDDRYVSTAPFAQGAAAFGVGILLDLDGDDTYVAGHLAQGMGLFGIGVLIDAAGNDRYEAGTLAQGAGVFGVGALVDDAGDDRYRATALAQAFGATGGVGVLLDERGDDTYVLAGGPGDFREPDQAQSFGQGFAMGIRPLAAGGVGLLVDHAGHDRYTASYFAQGASYWLGLGGLVDDSGDDRYLARRYAQGAGVHFGVGVLWDGGGDDEYRSWGVSQGCGHDLAVGVLADGGGSDRYESTWLSQGAGSADGLGLLLDVAGEDRFVAEADSVQGHGSGGRAQSLGFFVKVGGSGTYSGRGRPDGQWDGAEYGGGLDARGVAAGIDITPRPDPIAAARASAFGPSAPPGYVRPVDPSFPPRDETSRIVQAHLRRLLNPVDTPDGTATRAEARRELQAMGAAAVPGLVDLLAATNSVVALETVDALIALGAASHPALTARLTDANWLVRRRAAHVLAQTATPAVARGLATLATADTDPVVRASATEAMGRSPFAGAATIVAGILRADPDVEVRVAAAIALKAMPDDAARSALSRALGDPAFPVRLAARKTLAAIGR